MIYSISFSALFCLLTAIVDSSQVTLKLEPSYRIIVRDINDSLSVKCFVESLTDGTLTWIDPNGEPIPVTNNRNVRKRVELISNSSESTYAKLVLENLDEKDNGSYVCNHASKMSASFSLAIFEQITFDKTEKIQFAVIGTKFTIKCSPKLRGNDKPRVYWKINKRAIDFTRMTPLAEGLLINRVYKNDSENEYVCTAIDLESSWPQSMRQIIKLIVLKENFTESQLYGTLGQRVKLPCKASSKFPLAKYTWYDTSNQEIIPSPENQMCFIENSKGNMHILQVTVKNKESFGTYTCTYNSGDRTFGHKFRLNEVAPENFQNENFTQIEGQCSPPILISTEKPDIPLPLLNIPSGGQHTTTPVSIPALNNDVSVEQSENETFKPQTILVTTTTKKSSTVTTTQTVSTIINEDGSTTVKTRIISEETIIFTTGKAT